MRFWLWISLAAALAAAGCGESPIVESAEPAADQAAAPRTPPADLDVTSASLWLVGEEGETIAVGDGRTQMDAAFPRPARSLPLVSLPTSKLPYDLEVKGWQLGGEAVGALVDRGRVGLVLRISEADSAFFGDEAAAYRRLFGEPAETVIVEEMSAMFWERSGVRLMLAIVPQDNGEVLVSQAVGAVAYMDALQMQGEAFRLNAAEAAGAKERARRATPAATGASR